MKLFVSYIGVKKLKIEGVGNIVCEVENRETMDEDAIRKVENAIKEKNHYSKVIMLNYQIIEA